MKYPITEYDKELLLQHQLYYKIRVSVVNNDEAVIDMLTGIYTCGSLNIDSDSNIRRTANFTIKLDDFVDNIEAKISNWLGLYYVVELGIKDIRTDEYIYYPCGKYCITGASTEYNASTNSALLIYQIEWLSWTAQKTDKMAVLQPLLSQLNTKENSKQYEEQLSI